MANKHTGKIILGLSGLALLIGGILYFRKPKQDAEIPPVDPNEGKTDIVPPSKDPVIEPNNTGGGSKPVQYANIYSTANGAIMYTANMQPNGSATVGTKIRNVNKGDKVGRYFGERTIQGHSYYLVTASTGTKVLISKMVSESKF